MIKIKTGEFSNYGDYSYIVKEMVDNDKEVFVKAFYESLSSDKLNVEYIDNFWDALDKISKGKKGIIATRIEIVNQDHLGKDCSCNQKLKICKNNDGNKFSSHAVSLIRNRANSRIYMYDPNGVFYKEYDTWLYKSKDGSKLLDSERFMNEYKNYKIELPNYEGVQKRCNSNDEKYINNCDYCMFYNYVGIKYVVDNVKNGYKKDITKLIESVSDIDDENKKKLYNVFPNDNMMGPHTLKIIKSIF